MSYGSVEILVGDIVRTTGGGPEMVVVRFDGDGAHCTWSVGGREQTAWFSSACMVESGKRRVLAPGYLLLISRPCAHGLLVASRVSLKWIREDGIF